LNKVRLPADRATVLVGVTLVAVTVAAWVAFLAQAVSPTSIAMDTMSSGADLAGAAGFIGAWVVMMAAMMLPSAAPLVLLYRAAGAGWARGKYRPTRRRVGQLGQAVSPYTLRKYGAG
jgi:predicted metal-binding membrane protein